MNCWSVELHTISWICILSHLVNVCVCAAYTVLLETYIGPHHWQKWRWLDVGCSCLGLLRIITKKLQSEMYIKRQYSSQHHNNAKQRRHFGCLLSNLYIKVFPCFPPREILVLFLCLGLCSPHRWTRLFFIGSRLLVGLRAPSALPGLRGQTGCTLPVSFG